MDRQRIGTQTQRHSWIRDEPKNRMNQRTERERVSERNRLLTLGHCLCRSLVFVLSLSLPCPLGLLNVGYIHASVLAELHFIDCSCMYPNQSFPPHGPHMVPLFLVSWLTAQWGRGGGMRGQLDAWTPHLEPA